MRLWSALRSLLPVFAIVGIIVGPFTTPVNGHAMAAATMSEAPDDMTSCPDGRPTAPDSDIACPLTAICICFPSTPILSTAALPFRTTGDRSPSGPVVFGDPLAGTPLDRPPRN